MNLNSPVFVLVWPVDIEEIPLTFKDAWAELHPDNPDPSTINDDPVRLDYVYFQNTPLRIGQERVVLCF